LFASLFFSPGPAPGFFFFSRKQHPAGSRVSAMEGATHAEAMDGRESCRAYRDGATHAEARMAGSRVAHTEMAGRKIKAVSL